MDAAVAAVVGEGEDARLVRVWLPRPAYFVCGADEDPADLPILRARRGTRAEVVAVTGANGRIRPDSLREVPVGPR